MFFVRQGFVDGGNFTVNGENVDNTTNIRYPKLEPEAVQQSLLNTNVYERLAPTECVRAYANNFLRDRRNLVIVSNNGTGKNTLLFMPHYSYTYAVNAQFGQFLPFDW
jgi:hypothetical protein